MTNWRNRPAPTASSRAGWTRGGRPAPAPAPAPAPVPAREATTEPPASPPPASPPAPAKETLSLDELLDRREISRPTKADLLELADEFSIDISEATKNSARVNILAEYTFEVFAETEA